jgi:hypothetical protein
MSGILIAASVMLRILEAMDWVGKSFFSSMSCAKPVVFSCFLSDAYAAPFVPFFHIHLILTDLFSLVSTHHPRSVSVGGVWMWPEAFFAQSGVNGLAL